MNCNAWKVLFLPYSVKAPTQCISWNRCLIGSWFLYSNSSLQWWSRSKTVKYLESPAFMPCSLENVTVFSAFWRFFFLLPFSSSLPWIEVIKKVSNDVAKRSILLYVYCLSALLENAAPGSRGIVRLTAVPQFLGQCLACVAAEPMAAEQTRLG